MHPSGMYCDGCGCEKCQNTDEHRALVMKERGKVLARNPASFLPKVDPLQPLAGHKKGCRCKKSERPSGCIRGAGGPPFLPQRQQRAPPHLLLNTPPSLT